MRKKYLVITVLIIVTTITACRSLSNEDGSDWAVVAFSVGRANQNGISYSSAGNSMQTAMIIAVPARVTSVGITGYLASLYDTQLQNLTDGRVMLKVPLSTPIRLVKVVFIEQLTLDNIINTQPTAFSTGISAVFSLKGSEKSKTIGIIMDSSYYAKAITTFVFKAINNRSLSTDVTGSISESNHTISATIPLLAKIGSLVATFTISGTSITVGSTTQTSSSTVNDFSSDVTYTVTAAHGGTQAYTVNISVANMAHQAYLKSLNNSDGDFLGSRVAIADNTIVLGAYGETSDTTAIIHGNDLSSANNNGSNNGAVYVLVRDGSIWSHQAYLKASNNSNEDYFGESIAIAGDTIAVGAFNEGSGTTAIIHGSDLSGTNNNGTGNGAVYIFVRDGNTWSLQAYLKAPNNSNNDSFGRSIAIAGDTIVVGAKNENSTTSAIIQGNDLSTTNNAGSYNGAVYVFVRDGTTWSHQAYLKAPNNSDGDLFGESVAIAGDTIVVGARGERSTTTGIIHNSDLSSSNDAGSDNGAAYVFIRDGTTWSHQAYLKAPNNANSYNFGVPLAIASDTIVVGANAENSSTTTIIHGNDLSSTNISGTSNGAAYVFVRDGTTWSHQAYLKAPNNSDSDQFGFSVAIAGDTIVVGANQEDSDTSAIIHGNDLSSTNDGGVDSGAAYVFIRNGSIWSHQAYLKAPNNSAGDRFSHSVATAGDTIVVGAIYEASNTTTIIHGNDLSSSNNAGTNNGAAYIFQ